jgi:hypothetical protein
VIGRRVHRRLGDIRLERGHALLRAVAPDIKRGWR